MIDISHHDPKAILTTGLVIGIFLGGIVATLFWCFFNIRTGERFYKRGCTDTEKLIRDQRLKDQRNDAPLSKPIAR